MDRPSSDHLTMLLGAVEAEPRTWEFLALVRAVEQATPDLPRVGTALDPAREAIDLAHQPSANFPRTTIAGFERGQRRPVARSAFLGLTGPMGPLPFHLTEVAIFERDRRGPSPFADFLDLVSARMLQAFYRAWADGNPCAQADRPDDDRFAAFLGATSGAADLRFVTAAERPPKSEDGFDDWRRLTYGGQLASLRSASAVADLLSHLLERPVTVTECVGRWRTIPAAARTRIGNRCGAHNGLGRGATLGARFYAVEWNVAFGIRAESMDELIDLLPGGHLNRLLGEAARSTLPSHLEWEAQVEIDERAIKPARLGRARLGQTSWISTKKRPQVRTDLRLNGVAS